MINNNKDSNPQKTNMKKTLSLIVALCCSCAAMLAQGIAFEPEGTTLEQASVKAKAENKLIFLDCFTQWCGPCKKMAKDVFPQEKVGQFMNPKFVCLKIDMESAYGAPLAKKLQIQAYPTFVIFNADAQEIGRFLGGSNADDFIQKVDAKSKDNSGSALEERWKNGDRDPQFLMDYLKTLTAAYKGAEANDVAEALLEGKETSFVNDSTLRMVFMGNIRNPFAKSFVATLKDPSALKAAIGDMPVDMKIQNVLSNYQRDIITEGDGTAIIDQAKFDQFKALLQEANVPNANHYILTTLITLSDKQKDLDSYFKYIKEYLKDKNLDADDMTIARWVKPITPDTDAKYKKEMIKILQDRIDEIKSGKRQSTNRVGNMRLSVPTDQLLSRLIDAINGKTPEQH